MSKRWLKCDFHCHTTESDGRNTPEEMVAEYVRQGFDAIAITDHDRLTKVKSDKLLIIPGTEFTYEKGGGLRHLLMLFIPSMPENVNDARKLAAHTYAAHPITWPGAPRTFPRGIDGVESVNGLYGVKGGWLGKILMFLERMHWRRWRQIGCSDAHSVDQIGTVYTLLRADKTLLGIRTALLSPNNRDRRIVIDWKRIGREND